MLSEGAQAVDAARTAVGALREMLSALGNLQQLLRSRSVGPKALAPLLPEVVESAQPVLQRLNSFWPTLGVSPLAQCRAQLQSGMEQAISELQATLGHPSLRPLGAGARLKAEAVVSKALREFGGSLALFELVAELAASGSPNGASTEPQSERRFVDWAEALTLSRSGDQVQAPGCQLVTATVVIQAEPRPLPLGPRAALNLAAIMGSWVLRAAGSRSELCLAFEQGAPSGRLRVDRRPEPGQRINLWVPPQVAATESCLKAVAEARQLNLTLGAEFATVDW